MFVTSLYGYKTPAKSLTVVAVAPVVECAADERTSSEEVNPISSVLEARLGLVVRPLAPSRNTSMGVLGQLPIYPSSPSAPPPMAATLLSLPP